VVERLEVLDGRQDVAAGRVVPKRPYLQELRVAAELLEGGDVRIGDKPAVLLVGVAEVDHPCQAVDKYPRAVPAEDRLDPAKVLGVLFSRPE